MFDIDATQRAAARTTSQQARCAERVSLARTDLAAQLPLRLYILGGVREIGRAGGVVVALTTHKKLLSRVAVTQPLLQPASRHEVCPGGLRTHAVKACRRGE